MSLRKYGVVEQGLGPTEGTEKVTLLGVTSKEQHCPAAPQNIHTPSKLLPVINPFEFSSRTGAISMASH